MDRIKRRHREALYGGCPSVRWQIGAEARAFYYLRGARVPPAASALYWFEMDTLPRAFFWLPSLTLMKTSYLTNSTSVGWKQNHVDLHWYPHHQHTLPACTETRATAAQYFKSNSHFSQDALLFPPRASLGANQRWIISRLQPLRLYIYVLQPPHRSLIRETVLPDENYASYSGCQRNFVRACIATEFTLLRML